MSCPRRNDMENSGNFLRLSSSAYWLLFSLFLLLSPMCVCMSTEARTPWSQLDYGPCSLACFLQLDPSATFYFPFPSPALDNHKTHTKRHALDYTRLEPTTRGERALSCSVQFVHQPAESLDWLADVLRLLNFRLNMSVCWWWWWGRFVRAPCSERNGQVVDPTTDNILSPIFYLFLFWWRVWIGKPFNSLNKYVFKGTQSTYIRRLWIRKDEEGEEKEWIPEQPIRRDDAFRSYLFVGGREFHNEL